MANGKLYMIWRFYYEGFRSMTVGRVLWAIIFIKLFFLSANPYWY